MRNWLFSVNGVLLTAVFLTLIAALENSILPWAPFFVVQAVLALAIPLALKTYRFGSLRAVRWWHWLAGILAAVLIQLVGGLFLGLLVPNLFGSSGETAAGSSTATIGAALMAMYETAAARLNSDPATIQTAYMVMIFLWAAAGEELFYRGYMQGTLEKGLGFNQAMLISATFFALRHATQLLLLWPEYPVVAALAWMTFSFAFGLAMSYLYECTQSLTLPIFIHFLLNAIPLLVG
jgi:membrane protease YdiL (CAAX protease family)